MAKVPILTFALFVPRLGFFCTPVIFFSVDVITHSLMSTKIPLDLEKLIFDFRDSMVLGDQVNQCCAAYSVFDDKINIENLYMSITQKDINPVSKFIAYYADLFLAFTLTKNIGWIPAVYCWEIESIKPLIECLEITQKRPKIHKIQKVIQEHCKKKICTGVVSSTIFIQARYMELTNVVLQGIMKFYMQETK